MNRRAAPCPGCVHRSWSTLPHELKRDVARYVEQTEKYGGPSSRGWTRYRVLLMPQLLSVLIHRVAHGLHEAGLRRAADLVAAVNFALHKVRLTPASCIGGGFFLHHPCGVTFHGRAGEDLTMYSQSLCLPHDGPGGRIEDAPRLGRGVTIGGHGAVIGPVTLGDHATVAFQTVATADVPASARAISAVARARVRRLDWGRDPSSPLDDDGHREPR